MKKFVKTLVIILVIVAVAFVGLKLLGNKNDEKLTSVAREYTVEKGSIDSTISGKATIQPNDQYTVTSMVSGDVLKTYFEEGDIVQKDSVMYEIDSSDVSKSIESSKLALDRANMSLNTTNDSIEDLTIYSRYSGIVTGVTVKEGDNIQNGQVLASVYNDLVMTLKVPFNELDANNLSIGAVALITIDGTNQEYYGSVVSVESNSYSLSGFMRVKNVEIEVRNPGSIKAGDKATAIVGNYACNSIGVFENSVDEVLKATASGKIIKLNLKEKEFVNYNDVIVILDGETLETQKKNNEIAIREAELNQERALDSLDDYTITAPITGTVINKEVKVGDKLDNTKGASVLSIIYDMSSLKFDMDVDEVDVTKVKVGQEVKITADAFVGKTYYGVVEKVNINGTSSNGVTVYPVTVRITNFEDLLPGMNIDAEIILEKVEDVLVIPTECIQRGNTVFVKGDKEDDKDEAPEGFKTVSIKTGMIDSSFVEVLSGLSEGDVVRGKEFANTNGIMEMMEDMEDAMKSGEAPHGSMGGNMGGGMGGPPAGMR